MKKFVVVLLAATPMLAQAAVTKPTPVPGAEQSQQFQSSGAYAQVYYYPSADREATSPAGVQTDFSGDGFGVSGYFPFTVADFGLFAIGDYSMIDYDEGTGNKIDEIRAGIGYQFGPSLSAYAHYNDRDNGNGTGSDGYAVHGVYNLPFENTPFSVYADVGYFMLSNQADIDIDGFEFWVGGLYAINERFSGFLDYRASDFDVDNGATIKYYDFRTGLRVNF